MKREAWALLLQVLGMLVATAAGWMITPVLGLFVAAAALITAGVAIERGG
jgi:hypothetical protein